MTVVERKLTEIKPYERNPRRNDDAVKYVKRSIEEFGFKVPIVIDKEGTIVAGHTRYKAAKQLKMKTVPCVIADDLTEEQIRAFRLADNKTAEFAEWDFPLLNEELAALCSFKMPDFGFEIPDLFPKEEEKEKKEAKEDGFDVEGEVEAIVRRGDIWRLGEHILMCGDSTSEEEVDALMEGTLADLVFTDPPYGMKKESEGVIGDNMNFDDLLDFNREWIALSFDHLKHNGSWYCWGIDEPLMDIYSQILKPMIRNNQITFRNLITWDKGNVQGMKDAGHRSYPRADEKCLFVMMGVQGFNTNADNYYEGWEPIRSYLEKEWRKISPKNDWNKYLGNHMGAHYFTKSQWLLPTREEYEKLQRIGREYDAFKREYDDIKREYYKTRAYFDNVHDNMTNVWHFDPVRFEEKEDAGYHATPKPIALCSRAIMSSSREGETVLDLFGGSGSTLIAAEQLGRRCRMMELSEHWCDVIIKRWEKLTGKKAEKVV